MSIDHSSCVSHVPRRKAGSHGPEPSCMRKVVVHSPKAALAPGIAKREVLPGALARNFPNCTRPGKRDHITDGKITIFHGKLTISMAIFNSYVKLPEGIPCRDLMRFADPDPVRHIQPQNAGSRVRLKAFELGVHGNPRAVDLMVHLCQMLLMAVSQATWGVLHMPCWRLQFSPIRPIPMCIYLYYKFGSFGSWSLVGKKKVDPNAQTLGDRRDGGSTSILSVGPRPFSRSFSINPY